MQLKQQVRDMPPAEVLAESSLDQLAYRFQRGNLSATEIIDTSTRQRSGWSLNIYLRHRRRASRGELHRDAVIRGAKLSPL
jgi:hypothetical protein